MQTQRETDDDAPEAARFSRNVDLYTVGQLEQHAIWLASWHVLAPRHRRVDERLLTRLATTSKMLDDAYAVVTAALALGRRLTPAADWFVDNFTLIEEEVRIARRHLPVGYSKELARLANGAAPHTPRVYDMAVELVTHSHGRVDLEAVGAFVDGYQTKQALRLGELWAIPIMLRLALLENLRHIMTGVVAGRLERERANHWVDRMLETAARKPQNVVLVLAAMVGEDRPLTNAFAVEFASRLQGQAPALVFAMSWLEQRLAERGETVARAFQIAGRSQAADQVAIANTIGSLRFLGAIDWRDFVEAKSVVERVLRDDSVYAAMDFATRDRYRHVVEQVARRADVDERAVAVLAVEFARGAGAVEEADEIVAARHRHVGFFLIDAGLPRLEARLGLSSSAPRPDRNLGLYVGAVAIFTAALTTVAAAVVIDAHSRLGVVVAVVVVLALCSSQLAIALVQWLTTLLVHPTTLPRLDFSAGIPPRERAVVVVPTLFGSVDDVEHQLDDLEVRFLANRGPSLSFALLSDFRDANTETLPGDAVIVRRAVAGINALNARYRGRDDDPTPFFLFHRARKWNARERCFMGWERKRGKLEDFNGAVRGVVGRFDVVIGDLAGLQDAPWVIVLDADTELPRDAARQLVATAAHPLNRAVYNVEAGRVTAGYAILQPRVGVTMVGAAASRFAQIFAGDPGIDPYTHSVSDCYQDLFGEGSFVGKGIYDVDAVNRALGGRFPENRVLSHDLLEGAYARSGLVSDVTLFEDHPAVHAADVARRGRWIRGDWQVFPWLWPWVRDASGTWQPNPISLLSQWKIIDNLRRSLVAPAALLVLLGGWTLGAASFASVIVVSTFVLPGLLHAAAALWRRPDDLRRQPHALDVARTLGRQWVRDALSIAWLPNDALVCVDAVARAGIRMVVTRRLLLEWRTAHDVARAVRSTLAQTWAALWFAPALALVTLTVLASTTPSSVPAAVPLALLWLSGPVLAWWLGLPLKKKTPALTQEQKKFLHALARRSWRFFDVFVVEGDHHLPPDNVQDDPPRGAAHRTSPTNVGLALTATLAACDFGFLPVGEVIRRVDLTLTTMEGLERHRGHFFNWYDTQTLSPLQPRFVSTVDSGNLVGHLLVLAAGLDELVSAPLVPPHTWSALGVTLGLHGEACGAPAVDAATTPTNLGALIAALIEARDGARNLARTTDEASAWADAVRSHCALFLGDLRHLLGSEGSDEEFGDDVVDTSLDVGLAALITAADVAPTALDAQRRRRDGRATRAHERIADLRRLAARCRALADVDYDFLYDESRHLLSVGCHVGGAHKMDASFYDLLASEARLASFVAIAQGKLPQEHWFRLGRLLTTTGGQPTLLSWSGSMFEYLMPLLIMPSWPGTLLAMTCEGVVRRQIEYGDKRGVAWGVSESGYAKTDANLNYQYRAFGVPGLGFKRGLGEDLVIAPYATALALMIDAPAAATNLKRLADEGRLGSYGFFEAVDHTPSRMPPGKTSSTVRSYMAHHQGMSVLALASVLLDRPMQRRFEADPALRATELLLQERVPRSAPLYPHRDEVSAPHGLVETGANSRTFSTPQTPHPEVHLLSNGNYHVAVTNAGGGSSRWRDLAVTRFREDPTRDCWGSFCYLRDVDSGAFWSTTHQPTLQKADAYHVVFSQGRAETRRIDGDIESVVDVGVSAEDDVELRRVSLTNHGSTARIIELTTYSEVVLAAPLADASHPAFSNLFVQTELLEASGALLCTRRPRSGAERPPWMFHLMAVEGQTRGPSSFETSREEFIGRGRTVADPVAMYRANLGNTAGAVLDPVAAIRNCVVVAPYETVHVDIVTGVAESRELATALVEKYRDRHSGDRLLEMAWTHSQVVLHQLDITDADTQLYERLASSILFTNPSLRALPAVMAKNRRGQSALWAYGISGDLPIVLVRIGDVSEIELVRQLVKAHAYLRLKGVAVDLVIWNEDPSGYHQVLQDQIIGLVASPSAAWLDKPGGVFIRRNEQMSEEDSVLLQAVARVTISDARGTLAHQLDRRRDVDTTPAGFLPREWRHAPARLPLVMRTDLEAQNGMGGFTKDGREYVITTSRAQPTPAPWVNVLANPHFGTVVSESGSAYTWCENAHAHRLTPWNNDPVGDASGEAVYVRDEDDGRFWSPTAQPAPTSMPYTTRHGFGYSVFEHKSRDGIATEMQTFVAVDAPLKFIVIKVTNHGARRRRLSLTATFDLVLGAQRASTIPHVVTDLDLQSGALFAHSAWDAEFGQRVAFLDVSEVDRAVAGDRHEVMGRNGTPASPLCMTQARLSGHVGAGLDPCMAMQVHIELEPGQERLVAFTFGSGRDRADARALVARFRGIAAAQRALAAVWDQWNHLLGAVRVETPDVGLNHLTNGWLLYQVLASRIWARSGFYQSGGAFGFRDQLQDSMALVHNAPEMLRAQIIKHASRQFSEGDVQHWWHPPLGRGVRTHISDDYLWLPFAVCHYIDAVGDTGVLDEDVGFLSGRAVKADEDSYFDLPGVGDRAPLYEHCVRAIEHGLRFGAHGLPLMGSGDWNDGMNLVGEHGQGESVWLGFFLHDVLQRFAGVARRRGDVGFADRCVAEAARMKESVEATAWDGQWYLRAWFDDGTPLGASAGAECQIDSLPQSWSVLSKLGDPQRARTAMASLNHRLVRRDLGLIELFTPPFDTSPLRPGYVRGYVPGVRENGGQYTHAAVWATMAAAELDDAPLAWELFNLINPVRHGDSAAAIARYKVEPYVVAADVYSNVQHGGRGGWTWYSGSAGWMYRLVLENLLGLHLEVDRLRLRPLFPSTWESFVVHYRHRGTLHHIRIHNRGAARYISRIVVDGVVGSGDSFALCDDHREHDVEVDVGG